MFRRPFFSLSVRFALVFAAYGMAMPRDAWPAEIDCAAYFAKHKVGSTLPKVYLLDGELKAGKMPLRDVSRYDPNSLYIGVANGKDGNHHYYLMVGDKRFDGGINFFKPSVHHGKAAGPQVSKGVVFSLPVPAEVRDALKHRLTTGPLPRGFTCLHALCDLLQSTGVDLIDAAKGERVRAKVVAANLIDGKIKVQGKFVDKEAVEMLVSSEQELAHFLSQAKNIDLLTYLYVAGKGSTLATLGVAAGYKAYLFLVFREPPEDPESPWRSKKAKPNP